jgi:hypothetical protein
VRAEKDPEKLIGFNWLTRLTALEDFINISRHENITSYINVNILIRLFNQPENSLTP